MGYRFWAKPVSPIPDEWIAEHRNMVDFWNRLEHFFRWVARLPIDWRWNARRTARTLGNGMPIYWCNFDAVVEDFLNTRERAVRGVARTKTGSIAWPRWKPYRAVISFFMRQSGGWNLEQLFRKSKRFYLTRPDVRGRVSLFWTIRGATHEFHVILHRSFPEGAVIQNVRLAQEFKNHKRWRLSFNLRMPESEKQPHGDEVAVFKPLPIFIRDDLRLGDIYLNGVVRPVTWRNMDTYKQGFAYGPAMRTAYLKSLQQEADYIIEQMKTVLKPFIPELKRRGWKSNPERYRLAGIYKAAALLDDKNIVAALEDGLRRWRSKNNEKRGLQGRLSRHRLRLYQNFGKWLATRCKLIVLEDVDKKKVLQKEKRKYPRVVQAGVASDIREIWSLAAIGELYEWIEKQAAKTGTQVIRLDDFANLPEILAENGVAKFNTELSFQPAKKTAVK